MHEIGHTLGLRHNFRGSAGATRAQLADRTFTQANGLGVSVMDYSPPALSLDPEKQGDYHAGTIGTYDRWAIRYGYASLGPRELAAANGKGSASACRRSGLPTPRSMPFAPWPAKPPTRRTCTAPTRMPASVGSASIQRSRATTRPTIRSEWARDRVTLINGLFDSLDTRMVAPGQSYARLADRVQRSAERSLVRDSGHDQVSRWRDDGSRSSGRSIGTASADHGSGRASAGGAGLHHRRRLRGAGLSLPAGAVEPARTGPLAALGIDSRRGRPHRFPGAQLGDRAASRRCWGSCWTPSCWPGFVTRSFARQTASRRSRFPSCSRR